MTKDGSECNVPAHLRLGATHEKPIPCGKPVVAEVDMPISGHTIHFDLCQEHAEDYEKAGVSVEWKESHEG